MPSGSPIAKSGCGARPAYSSTSARGVRPVVRDAPARPRELLVVQVAQRVRGEEAILLQERAQERAVGREAHRQAAGADPRPGERHHQCTSGASASAGSGPTTMASGPTGSGPTAAASGPASVEPSPPQPSSSSAVAPGAGMLSPVAPEARGRGHPPPGSTFPAHVARHRRLPARQRVRQRLLERRLDHAHLGDEPADQRGRRDVQDRVVHLALGRWHPVAVHLGQLHVGALLRHEAPPVADAQVDRRGRGTDVQRDAVPRGHCRHRIGPDRGGHVAVAGDPLRADQDRVHAARGR